MAGSISIKTSGTTVPSVQNARHLTQKSRFFFQKLTRKKRAIQCAELKAWEISEHKSRDDDKCKDGNIVSKAGVEQ